MTFAPSIARTLILPRRDATPRGFIQAPGGWRWQDKHPSELADYGVDLEARLDPGDVVLLFNAAVTPSSAGGLAIVDQTFTGKVVAVRLTDGVLGADYVVTFTVGTAGGAALVVPVSLRIAITG